MLHMECTRYALLQLDYADAMFFFFFFITLGQEMSDTKVYEP